MKSSAALSRDFIDAGIERKAADVIADAIVDVVVPHMDESYATKTDIAKVETKIAELKGELKADIAKVEGELKTIVALIKAILGLMVGLYVAVAVIFLGGGG